MLRRHKQHIDDAAEAEVEAAVDEGSRAGDATGDNSAGDAAVAGSSSEAPDMADGSSSCAAMPGGAI